MILTTMCIHLVRFLRGVGPDKISSLAFRLDRAVIRGYTNDHYPSFRRGFYGQVDALYVLLVDSYLLCNRITHCPTMLLHTLAQVYSMLYVNFSTTIVGTLRAPSRPARSSSLHTTALKKCCLSWKAPTTYTLSFRVPNIT